MIKTAIFAAAAAIATVATAAPVLAKDVVVRYGDLDLTSNDGQRTLARRIDRAARSACDFTADGRLPSHSAVKCYREARAKATATVATLNTTERLGG